MPHRQASYQVLADMTLLFGGHHEELVSEYRRSLDLDDGIASVDYRARRRQVPARDVRERPRRRRRAALRDRSRPARSNSARTTTAATTPPPGSREQITWSAARSGPEGRRTTRARGCSQKAARCEVTGDHISVREPMRSRSSSRAATDFRTERYERTCGDALDAAGGRPYDELRARHVESHRPPMRRVRLRLTEPRDPELEALPTDARLERVKAGGLDPGLVELHFQFGRYLLLGSSRPGTMPANLQGIWNDSYQPAWDSKFTININLQMNYWPAEVANLAECHEPLFDLIDRASCHGRAYRRGALRLPRLRALTTTPTSGPTPHRSTTSSAASGRPAPPGSPTTSGIATPSTSTRCSFATAPTRP